MLVWLGAVALIAGAVVTLRATDDPRGSDAKPDDEPKAVVVDRYAADYVVLPAPGDKPRPPANVVATPAGGGALRVSWADGLPGGQAPDRAAGYEVRWRQDGDWHTRLVATPDVLLDGLDDGRKARVEVRTVDPFGQRSAPAATEAAPRVVTDAWRGAMTGLYDDFDQPARLRERWHLSGNRGCVDVLAERGRGLPIDLGCGADLAILRARQPMTLTPPGASGVLGRVAIRTDTAGAGGELTVTFTPGPADRVGVDTQRAGAFKPWDDTLPGGTIRVGIDSSGVHVSAAPDVPSVRAGAPQVLPAPRRGPGVPHLYEVVLTTSGLRVYQDGLAVGVAGVVPTWQSASVLFGFRGPDRRRSRVHVLSAGFTGPSTDVPVVTEVPIDPGTERVLSLTEQSPKLSLARTPLTTATAARLVATIVIADSMAPGGVVVQLGDLRVPARPVSARPAATNGAALTVAADIPASLLGTSGADQITPFVIRAAGANQQVRLVETYLEVTRPGRPDPLDLAKGRRPDADMLPSIDAVLCDAAGKPLTTAVVPRSGQVILSVNLEASASQWETGAIGGVQGFEVWLDNDRIAGVPTRTDGPGLGGANTLSMATGGLARGPHVLEVREYAMDGTKTPVSAVLNFTVR